MTAQVFAAISGISLSGWKCWRCGRFAKLLSVVPYPDEFGRWFKWRCKKCGIVSEGT